MSDLKWVLPLAFIWSILFSVTGLSESDFFFISAVLAASVNLLLFRFRLKKDGVGKEKIDLELCKKICDDNNLTIQSRYGGFVIKDNPMGGDYCLDVSDGRRLDAEENHRLYCLHNTLLDAQKWIMNNIVLVDRSYKPVFGAGVNLIQEQKEEHLELKDLMSQMVDAHNRGDLVKEEEIFDIIEKRKLV